MRAHRSVSRRQSSIWSGETTSDRNFGIASASGAASLRDEMPNLNEADKDIKLDMALLQGTGADTAAKRLMLYISERTPLHTS